MSRAYSWSILFLLSRVAACFGLGCYGLYAGPGEIPAGSVIEIRLTHSVASYSTKEGTKVDAVVIAPVRQGEQTLIPMGTQVTGVVEDVRRVGLGLIHETARLDVNFNLLVLPNGNEIPVKTHVAEVENARESVDAEGRIRGIRSTGTLGYRANNLIAGFALFDPIAYLYVNVAAARMLRFAEPEIWLPAGTELELKLLAPVAAPEVSTPPMPPVTSDPEAGRELASLVRTLPYRTMTQVSYKPSDLTNLIFLGNPDALKRAFRAAGWVQADHLNTISGFMTMRSIAENQGYQAAPMSTLLLDEQRPDLTISKTLNTFSKRHHARIWLRSETWNGNTVMTASSTQDTGIELSRRNRTFIHVIDTFIDNERAKIVDDLVFTGCVDAAELMPRPWVPLDARNATGEALVTDGRVAILQLNQCEHPRGPVDLEASPDIPAAGNAGNRGVRQSILTVRNDFYRGNLVYQGYEGVKFGVRHLKHKEPAKELPPRSTAINSVAAPIDWNSGEAPRPRQSKFGDLDSAAKAEPPTQPPQPEQHDWGTERFEIGLEGGFLRYGGSTLDLARLSLEPQQPGLPVVRLAFQNRLYNGWSAGTSLTLNTFRYFSNEFAFTYQRGKYRFGALAFVGLPEGDQSGYDEETTGLLTRQFQYNFIANFRPREKRFRPYVAAGPVLQLINLTDAPFKSSGGLFRFGLRNVGLLLAAYNFGSAPPLDGGGIFQFGFQFGGGVKFRLTPRWLVRLDVRETVSAQPDFIGRSITIDDTSPDDEYRIDYQRVRPAGPLRQQRATLGFAFTF
jgi:opacity protein-like surface antigen